METQANPAIDRSGPGAGDVGSRGLGRRGAWWLLINGVVGLVLSAAMNEPAGMSVVFSECIGMSCWLLIDGGRLLVARFAGSAKTGDPSWPGWGWMAVCIVIGVPLGYVFGNWLGGAITGHPLPLPMQSGSHTSLAGPAVALLLSLAGTVYFLHRSRLDAARAEAETARRAALEHQLRLLESQLEPHMLFNTLANLRALIAIEPAKAQQMLDRLIAFLRSTLYASRATTHPLAEEFRRIEDYLSLMGIRMGARLQSVVELPPALERVAVPPLLLQPLVENAIRHGLEPKAGGGRIEVRAGADGDRIVLSVRDTGAGLSAMPAISGTAERRSGFGLDLVRQRLAAQYGGAAALRCVAADDPEGGTLSRIELPAEPMVESTATSAAPNRR